MPTEAERLNAAADWLQANSDKQGSPEWQTVAEGYRDLRVRDLASKGYGGTALGQYMSGLNEGIADMVGAPVDVTRWGANMAGRGVNAAAEAVGMDAPLPRDPIPADAAGGSEWLKRQMGSAEMIAPPAPGQEGVRKAGQYTGMGLTTLMTGGAAAARGVGGNVVQSLFAPATKTPGATAAGVAAEAAAGPGAVVGEQLGGDLGAEAGRLVGAPETGRAIGTVAGNMAGGAAPAVAAGGAAVGARKAFSDDDSAARFAAAERQGIRPSVGLVGNKAAARAENFLGDQPVVGRFAQRVQEKQDQQLAGVVEGAGQRLSGGRPISGDAATAGSGVSRQLDDRLGAIKREIGDRENALELKIGARTLVAPRNAYDAFVTIRPKTAPKMQKVVDEAVGDMAQMMVSRDPELKQQLMQARAVLRARLDEMMNGGTAPTGQTLPGPHTGITPEALREKISQIEDLIFRQGGTPYEQLRDFRTQVGADMGKAGLKKHYQGQIYDGITQDLRATAQAAGARDEFDALMAWQRNLRDDSLPLDRGGDLPFLEKVAGQKSGDAWDTVRRGLFKNPEELSAVYRNLKPEERGVLSAEIIYHLGLPTPGARGATTVPDFSPNTFATNWHKLKDRAKLTLTGGDWTAKQMLDDAATIAGAMKDRATTGGTGPTSGAVGQVSGLATAAGIGNLLYYEPTAGLAALVGVGATYKGLLSEGLARMVAKQSPSFRQRLDMRGALSLPRAVSAAGEIQVEQQPGGSFGVPAFIERANRAPRQE